MIANGVVFSTQEKYRTGVHLWTEYRLPQGNPSHAWMYMIDHTHREVVIALLDFLRWMIHVKGTPATSACHHLTGVRFAFRNHACNLEPFADDSLKSAKTGLVAKSSQAIRDRKVIFEILPLVITDLDRLRNQFFLLPESSLHERITYMAIVSAFNVSLRIGEVAYGSPFFKLLPSTDLTNPEVVSCISAGIPAPLVLTEVKQDHRFFLSDILLEDDEGSAFSYDDYMDTSPQARPNIAWMRWDSGSTKSSRRQLDKHSYSFGRECERESQFLSDFLHYLEIRGRTSSEVQLFSCMSSRAKTGVKMLTESMVREMVKSLAPENGISSNHYSGKSLRKGGATSMGASGRSVTDILANTGHAGINTSAIYTNTGGATGNALRNPAVVTVQHLKRSLPVNNRVTNKTRK